MAGVGDVDGNGVLDIVVGSPSTKKTSTQWGSVYVLQMQADGGIHTHYEITTHSTGVIPLVTGSSFGDSVAGLGDLDGDGTPGLAVGAPKKGSGAVYILLLNNDGSVKGHSFISINRGGLVGPLVQGDFFGSSVATLVERGDSEEGVVTLVVGARYDSEGAKGGAVYVLTGRWGWWWWWLLLLLKGWHY